MRHWLAPVLLASSLCACDYVPVNVYAPQWIEWEQAYASPHWSARISRPDQIEANRECWRGTADLSAEFLLFIDPQRLALLGQITDDCPLQQPRPAREYPRWWLQRRSGDAVDLIIHTRGGERVRLAGGLGSAGVSPEVIGAEGLDSLRVLPMPSGARLRLDADLTARGLAAADVASAEIWVHDSDGPGDWTTHRAELR